MSLGKLTLLSADCEGSGAVVGSSVMVADSSGAEGTGGAGLVAGGGAGVPAPAVPGTAGAPAPAVPGTAGVLAPRAVAGADAEPAKPAPFAGAVCRVACSAARSVTMAAPDRTTPLTAITQINRLFGITHHSKAYGCTGTVRAVTPGQSQLRRSGRLPIGPPYDVTSAVFLAQWIGDWR
jgi:hypothetical protein